MGAGKRVGAGGLFLAAGNPLRPVQHAPATEDEEDRDGGVVRVRRVCRLWHELVLGPELTKALADDPGRLAGGRHRAFRYGATVSHTKYAPGNGTVAEDNLELPKRRSLMAYVPHDNDGSPTWFVDIAEKARATT